MGHSLSALLLVMASGNCPAVITAALRPQIHISGLGIPGATNAIGVGGYSLGGSKDLYLADRSTKVVVSGTAGADLVDIVAPFDGVTVLGQAAPVSFPGRTTASGTSFSTPFVAGAAALAIAYNQAFEDSCLHGQPAAIKARILANADKNVAADQVVDGGVTFTGSELVRDGNRLNVPGNRQRPLSVPVRWYDTATGRRSSAAGWRWSVHQ